MKKRGILTGFALVTLVASALEMPYPKTMFYSTHGESVDEPENTMQAFRFDLERGFPVEADLRVTADGEVVCLFDADAKRVAEIAKPVAQCNWKGELENANAGAWKEKYASWPNTWIRRGYKIARLDELLKALPKGMKHRFRIRDGRPEARKAIDAVFARHPEFDRAQAVFVKEFGEKLTTERIINDPVEAVKVLKGGAKAIVSDSASLLYARIEGYLASKEIRLDKKRFIAHRGDSEKLPENTLPAFKKAIEGGFGIECDVYVSQDDVLFASHEFELNRKGNNLPPGKFVTNVCWKGELEFADAGAWKGPEFKGLRYARLDEILELVSDDHLTVLDIKDRRYAKVMPAIKKAVDAHPNVTPRNFFLQGGDAHWIQRNMPGWSDVVCATVRRGFARYLPPNPDIPKMVDTVDPKVIPRFSLMWDEQLVTKEFVDRLHARGLQLIVWIVNDPYFAFAALNRGVDWVCGDRPCEMYEEMKKIQED